MQDYVIGVDIGGTNIKMGGVDYRGTILESRKFSTDVPDGSEAILQKLISNIRNLAESVSGHHLKGIGFGIPGAIRQKDGVLTQAPNIQVWNNIPIRKILEDRLQVPCFIENDANAIGLGEAWMGAGRGFTHVCCLTLGTGVGGGVLIDGELLRGADGMAAELGHIAVQADGAPCNCGSRGCLEMFASATGMRRMFFEALSANESSTLTTIPATEVSPEHIYNHAKQGDAVAKRILDTAGFGLGVGMASLVNIFNPEVMIIGGGVAAAWDLLMPRALETMKMRAFHEPGARVKVVPAEKQNDAGIYGSAYVAWDALQRQGTRPAVSRSLAPWGYWEVLEEGNNYKVKRLVIHPGHRLSYQRHEHREETWMVACGEAMAKLDDREHRLRAGETIHVPKGSWHRIGNPGDSPVVFFEVQRGSYMGEDDIERKEDDYARA